MKASIDVHDRKEAEIIREGLAIPEIRAFVKVASILAGLRSDRARARVLAFVEDHFAEVKAELAREAEKRAPAPEPEPEPDPEMADLYEGMA